MSVGAPPPPQPPQLSPDRKWVWDGTQWRPLAVHEAVFPSWSSVGAGVPAEVKAVEAPPSARAFGPPPAAPSPAPLRQVPVAEAEAPVPLWVDQPRPSGTRTVVVVVSGVIILGIGGVVLSPLLPTSLPWQQTAAGRAAASPTPPITDYSELGRADRLVNKLIAPPMASLTQALIVVGETCNGQVTAGCEDALSNTDNQVQKVLAVIDHEYIPACVATNVDALRADLQKMDSAALQALKGAKDGQAAGLASGLGQLGAARSQLQADDAALRNAAKSSACSPI